MNQKLEEFFEPDPVDIYTGNEMIEWNLDCYYSEIIPDMRVEEQFDIVFNAPSSNE